MMTTSFDPPRVIITASDRYLPALRICLHQLNKYWTPNPFVSVVGFASPPFVLPDNVEFVSVGDQKDYPFNRWSDAIINYLQTIDDDIFALMLEDYFIIRQVDTKAIKVLYDYMVQFGYVIKMDLCGDRLYAHGADLEYGYVSYLDLVKSMPGSPYHMSLMSGLWNRKHLLRTMIPGESPHDLEVIGTTRLSHDQNVIVLGTRQWPLRYILGLRANNPNGLSLVGMSESDAEELRDLGYLKCWENKR